MKPLLSRAVSAIALTAALTAALATTAWAEPLKLTDQGDYRGRGVDVLVFNNWYDDLFSDSKISGVELIQHEARTATNGDVRLSATPGQWDPIGKLVERKVDAKTGVVEATLEYPDYRFRYVIRTEPRGDGVAISVVLDQPLPAALQGKAGFNLEFLPSAYFHKSYMADGRAGLFPFRPASRMQPPTPGPDGPRAEPAPLARGKTFVLAPEDPAHRVELTSETGEMALYDGRNQAQNGWFVVRAELPAGKTGRVLEWTLTPHAIPGWTRAPVIAHSQVGYTPAQKKVAVIELDRNDRPQAEARLLKISESGEATPVLSGPVKPWGPYLRYEYATFDFSAATAPGLYEIEYAGQRTAPFRIAPDVYADAWRPTLEVYLPVEMDHVSVREAYRIWHGECHRDDALQAPPNHEHFDLYAQGPTTDTKFKALEHIPGLNVGGWHDAGDFDIRTQTQYAVVRSLVNSWEEFGLKSDDTTVDEARRKVEIHVPDGAPDVLEQIEHGTLQLAAQFDAVGHALNGIIDPNLSEYRFLGDVASNTDGLIYEASFKPGQDDGRRSGVPDDRWAFTSKSSALNYGSIAALAAASRALHAYRPELAARSLAIATRVWDEEQSHAPDLWRHGNTTGGDLATEEFSAAVELLTTTRDPKYASRIDALWPEIEKRFAVDAALAAKAIPYMPASYRARMEPAVRRWKAEADKLLALNPYGVPISTGGWAGSGQVIGFGLNAYALHKAFPEIVDAEPVFRALDYLYGTHPGSSISLVSDVGTVSKEVAYGNNRADFTSIPGGVVPGELIIKPDFPENKEDWPFLWGENEYVVNEGSSYVELVQAALSLVSPRPPQTAPAAASDSRTN